MRWWLLSNVCFVGVQYLFWFCRGLFFVVDGGMIFVMSVRAAFHGTWIEKIEFWYRFGAVSGNGCLKEESRDVDVWVVLDAHEGCEMEEGQPRLPQMKSTLNVNYTNFNPQFKLKYREHKDTHIDITHGKWGELHWGGWLKTTLQIPPFHLTSPQ